MDVTIYHKKYVCIEYPGIVENKDKMIETLGGEKLISKIYSEPSRRLELRLRPKDIYCKCCHGDRFNTTNLLMKVTRRRKKNGDPKDYIITKAEIMGTVEITYKFRSIMDYQYLPIQHNSNKTYESLQPLLITGGLQLSTWLQDEKEAPIFIQPPLFSRFDQPSNYHFRRDPQQKDPSKHGIDQLPPHIIGRNRKRRSGFAVFINFEDGPVPAKCTDEAQKLLQQKKAELKFADDIKKAFEERPVWSRNALGDVLGIDRSQFKFLLPTVAYYFLTGPWRTFWCRFGYDPRLDPAAKPFQTLDVRIRLPPIPGIDFNYRRSIQLYNLPNKTSTPQPRIGTIEKDTFLQTNDEVEETQGRGETKMCKFKPGLLPKHKQVFYQICDIEMDEVQELVNRNNGQETTCHEKDGWCLAGTLDRCRELILKDVRATIEKLKKDKTTENATEMELEENESDYEAEEMEEYEEGNT